MELKTSTMPADGVLVPASFHLYFKFVMVDKLSVTRNASFILLQLLQRREAEYIKCSIERASFAKFLLFSFYLAKKTEKCKNCEVSSSHISNGKII